MKPVIDAAVLSAKRASSNPSMYEKAFITSFIFEYNAKRLDELAREPWTYLTSLKALSDAISVTKSSLQADAVASKYSYVAASKINGIYGNLFLGDTDFRNRFKVISSIYKLTTGLTLSIK